eukprot:scaffold34577_cov30-Tisochrysis_lutea.AAC.1
MVEVATMGAMTMGEWQQCYHPPWGVLVVEAGRRRWAAQGCTLGLLWHRVGSGEERAGAPCRRLDRVGRRTASASAPAALSHSR